MGLVAHDYGSGMWIQDLPLTRNGQYMYVQWSTWQEFTPLATIRNYVVFTDSTSDFHLPSHWGGRLKANIRIIDPGTGTGLGEGKFFYSKKKEDEKELLTTISMYTGSVIPQSIYLERSNFNDRKKNGTYGWAKLWTRFESGFRKEERRNRTLSPLPPVYEREQKRNETKIGRKKGWREEKKKQEMTKSG